MTSSDPSLLRRKSLVVGVVFALLAAFSFAGAGAAAASADGAGTITGTVTSGGTPVPGISVYLTLPGGSSVQTATTADDGTYSLTGLPAAAYVVEFTPDFGAPYVAQWWNDATSAATANVITLASGATAVADASLLAAPPATATISGRVVHADGTAAAFADVSVSPVDENTIGYEQTSGSALTDANGDYTVTGLQPDNYTVQFIPQFNSNDVTSFWDGQTDAAKANPLAVSAGQTVTGIDGTLGVGATISGIVDAASDAGVSLSGGQVSAETADGNTVASGFMGADGSYTVAGVPTGTYTLRFQPPFDTNYAPQWWQGASSLASAEYFAVTAGSALTGYNADLSAAASISGTLNAAGAPIGSLQGGSAYAFSTSGDGSGNTGFVNADGTYTIPGLAPGSYTLSFQAPFGDSHAQQWWHDASSPTAATPITLAAGQSLTGIDAVLGAGGTISGTVQGRSASGALFPVQSAQLSVYSTDGALVTALPAVDQSGAYSVTNLPAGTYVIDYQPQPDTTDFIPQWWKNKSSEATATPITIKAGQTKANINVVLASTALNASTPKISGTAKVGHTLTAKPGKWGPGTVAFAYQWSRGGIPIAGATASTYALTNADAAATIAVTVTGSETNYTTQSLTSANTAAVAGGTLTTAVPTITGTLLHGHILSAVVPAWAPGIVALTYQWFRGSSRIAGATASTYPLVTADIGRTIDVRVTGAETDFTSATVASAPTGTIH